MWPPESQGFVLALFLKILNYYVPNTSSHLQVFLSPKSKVVSVVVDWTTSCTDGSQCRSPRLLTIGHCSTQPLAQPGV